MTADKIKEQEGDSFVLFHPQVGINSDEIKDSGPESSSETLQNGTEYNGKPSNAASVSAKPTI